MSWPSGSRMNTPAPMFVSGDHLAAELGDPAELASRSSTDSEICVRPGSFMLRGRYGWVWPVGREVQELEHEAVANEIRRGHPQRGVEAQELRPTSRRAG